MFAGRNHDGKPEIARRSTYLDNFATTRVDPRVLQSMLPYFGEQYGNPGVTTNDFGRAAHNAVERARNTVRRLMGGSRDASVVFTSGATESNNLAIRSVAQAHAPGTCHFVTSMIEHKAVLEPFQWLERRGYAVTYVPVSPDGLVDPQQFIEALRKDTVLASLMLVNNETGAIQPVAEIGQATRARGVLFHTDATQAIGKVAFDPTQYNVDLVSFSAHKIYGPKGVGALYAGSGNAPELLSPLQLGGNQEQGLRPGTHNVAGIVGLAASLQLIHEHSAEERVRIGELRDHFSEQLCQAIDGVELNSHASTCVPHALNLSIRGIRSNALLEQLPEIACSSTAACSGKNGFSYVLSAMGLPESRIRSAIRFGLGRFNTQEDVDYAVERIAHAVQWIRSQPVYGPE